MTPVASMVFRRRVSPHLVIITSRVLLKYGMFFGMLFLGCGGGVVPSDPTGIAVWADDCSSIACAINNSEFDGRVFMNHPTNERYDIALYNADGTFQKTVLANRQIDGYTSSVEEIYYMKSRGYLLIKTLMYNCGGRRIEKVSTDGVITQLYQLGCDAGTDQVTMVPSLRGTYIARAYFKYSATTPSCDVSFFDSTGISQLGTTVTIEAGFGATVKWIADSVLVVLASSQRFAVEPMHSPVSLPDSQDCTAPITSSSAYCGEKGYISFVGSTQSISFAAKPPSYLRWCE